MILAIDMLAVCSPILKFSDVSEGGMMAIVKNITDISEGRTMMIVKNGVRLRGMRVLGIFLLPLTISKPFRHLIVSFLLTRGSFNNFAFHTRMFYFCNSLL
jgi:hypothetical protein